LLSQLAKQRLEADPALAARARAVTQPPPSPYVNDVAAFIQHEVIIDDAQPDQDSDALATMPFHMWDAQRDLLADIVSERLLFILKARQLGISWLVCAYVLWLCLYRPGRVVLMFSIGQVEANELLRRVNVMYWRLSDKLRATLPALVKENTTDMAWANGSHVQSLPTSQDAGSSYTASLVVLDEFAKNRWARSLYTAVKPTVDGGGAMIILSTAKGKTNLFYDLCQRAIAGASRFAFRFLPWQSRPGRDAAWYAAVEADAVDSSLMKQEYPATADEAFEATEVDTFLPDIALWDACQELLPPLNGHTPCVLALDGAESNDTFASLMVSAHPADAARLAVRYVRPYVPSKGAPLDFNEIEIDLRELGQAHAISQLAYDPFLLGQLIMRLKKPATLYRAADTAKAHPLVFPAFPAPCEPFHQGPDRLVADKGLYDEITTRMTAHDGNAALRAHLSNANRKVDSESRKLRIVKRTYALKIDLAVCLSMARQRAREVLGLPSGADLVDFLP
jgi:hypothetical protein